MPVEGPLSSPFFTHGFCRGAKFQNGQGGFLDPMTLSYVSLTAVPEIDPAGASSVLALLASALGLLERRARRMLA